MIQLKKNNNDLENFETHKKINTPYFVPQNHTTFASNNFSLDMA